jgi:hypothetical protein
MGKGSRSRAVQWWASCFAEEIQKDIIVHMVNQLDHLGVTIEFLVTVGSIVIDHCRVDRQIPENSVRCSLGGRELWCLWLIDGTDRVIADSQSVEPVPGIAHRVPGPVAAG